MLTERAAALRAALPAAQQLARTTLARWFPAGQGRSLSITQRKGYSDGVRPALTTISDLGLLWLAAHEDKAGGWSCAAFDASCGELGAGACSGGGNPQFDVGVTGLALLCFLRSGQGPESGPCAPVVRDGLQLLVSMQAGDGNFGNPAYGQSTYDHAVATLALLEALSFDTSGALRAPAERAVAWLVALRNPGKAWRYIAAHPEMKSQPNDISVTGWAIQVLVKAREEHIDYDAKALTDALAYVEAMTDPKSGVTGYYERGQRPARGVSSSDLWPCDQTESMTAVGLLARLTAFPTRKYSKGSPVQAGVARVAKLPPAWTNEAPGRRDFYYWMHGTEALSRLGGTEWSDWKRALTEVLVEHVTAIGDATGSIDPQQDPWGHEGGRVYSTSMLVLAAIDAAAHD